MLRVFKCRRCGTQESRECKGGRTANFCRGCYIPRNREGGLAMSLVKRAIARGELPPAREFACTDCGKPASQYEHRDYTKPLDVQPICRSCNAKRGPAYDSLYRPESESFHTPRIVAALSRACYGHADDQPK